jgi:putative Ca2+/H+ antiporter (TMEM165/GDT1 family)
MLQSIFIPFFTVLVAEFLDKSQLSLILLASKTKKHGVLLLGAILAFFIVDGIAIFFGSYLTTFIPKVWINLAAAALFILFGLKTLFEKRQEKKTVGKLRSPFFSGFTLIFLSEWGDKTQLAAALFSARFDPLPVLLGVMAALTLLSLMAVILSRTLLSSFDRAVITKITGIIFIVLGISFLFFR